MFIFQILFVFLFSFQFQFVELRFNFDHAICFKNNVSIDGINYNSFIPYAKHVKIDHLVVFDESELDRAEKLIYSIILNSFKNEKQLISDIERMRVRLFEKDFKIRTKRDASKSEKIRIFFDFANQIFEMYEKNTNWNMTKDQIKNATEFVKRNYLTKSVPDPQFLVNEPLSIFRGLSLVDGNWILYYDFVVPSISDCKPSTNYEEFEKFSSKYSIYRYF